MTLLADPPAPAPPQADAPASRPAAVASGDRRPVDRRPVAGVAVLAALVAALGVAALAGAFSGGGDGSTVARLEVQGVVQLERAGGSREVVTGRADLRDGDRVRVTDGTAHLRLDDGVAVELRAGTGDRDDSVVLAGAVPALERGDALVTAGSAPGRVVAAGTEVEVSGAAQVSRALGMGVAVYDGLAVLDSAGQERTVPALRQLQVPALGRPPRTPLPLDYDASDPWDRRYLASAMELGEQLEAMARGYTGNLAAGEGTTAAFFAQVLPGLAGEVGFGDDLIDPARPPGETLVGAAIADLGVRGSFVERWEATFAFRDQGAAWGLVALDQGVNRSPLLSAVELAVQGSPLEFAAPAPAGGTTSPPPGPPSAPAPVTTTTTAPPPEPPPTSAPPTTDPEPLRPVPPPPSPPDLIGGLLGPVVDPVGDVIESTGEVTDEVVDLIGGLLRP